MSFQLLRRLLFSLTLGLSLLAWTAQADDTTTAEWKAFRAAYKFHIQTVAVSRRHADGSRTVIVSEPPPHVTRSGLENLDPVFKNADVFTNTIGHDGWVKDVVVAVPASYEETFADLITRLNQYLFLTAYKTSFVPIPISQPRSRQSQTLDLNVSAAQLNSWLVGSRVRFVPLLGGEPASLSAILQASHEGVYLSGSPGLILWVFPRNKDLSERAIEAREFALDSDLILGGMETANSVAVVGRERVVPTDALPPLRVETILLLASVHSEELAQSYERTNFAAGKFDNRNNADWAPIYLSDELIDTEYGSLLNVTDQLLKSWSSNGTVRYENFDYPTPRKYPFEKPVIELLGVPVLTFNWNTTGVGYAVAGTNSTTVALHRTGALPVSYIPEGHVEFGSKRVEIIGAEDRAYDYFAGRSDPNLVRVVQYAALYQIFRRFGVQATVPLPMARGSQEKLTEVVAQALDRFAKLDESAMKQNLSDLIKRGQLTKEEMAEVLESADHLEEVQDLIRQVETRWGDQGVRTLVQLIVDPRGNATHSHEVFERLDSLLLGLPKDQQDATTQDLQSATTVMAKLDHPTGVFAKLGPQDRKELALHSVAGEVSEHRSLVRALTGVSVVSLKEVYEEGAMREDRGWIRTPSIVVSYTQEALASGGHNLSSKVTEFRQSEAVPLNKIELKVEGEKRIVFYNPRNEEYPAELTGLVAKYGRYIPDDAFERVLNQEVVTKIHPPPPVVRDVALGFSAETKPSVDRGLQREYTASRLAPSGFRTVSQRMTAEQSEFVRSLSGETIKGTVVERRSPTSIMIYNGSSGEVIEATDRIGTVDALGQIAKMSEREGRRPFFLFRKGFTDEEADALAGAVRLNAEVSDVFVEVSESSAKEMSLLVKDDLLDLGATKVHESVEIIDSSTGVRGVEVSAEIPFRSKVASFFVTVRIWFRGAAESFGAFAQSARLAVQEAITKILQGGEDWSAVRVATEAKRQLRERFGDDVKVLLPQIRDFQARRNRQSHAFAS